MTYTLNAEVETSAPIELARERSFRLGDVTVEPAARRIAHDDGRESFAEPRVMRVLVALASAGGAVRTRDDLMRLCWDGRIVGDGALDRVISRLRTLCAEMGGGSFRIETLPKVGYRLIAAPGPVGTLPEYLPGQSAATRTPSRRWALAAGVTLAAAAAAIALATHKRKRTGSPGLELAVPAFETPGRDQSTAELGLAVHHQVAADLTRLGATVVAAPRHNGDAWPELSLRGVVTPQGDGARIQLSLSSGAPGREIWSDTLTAAKADYAATPQAISALVLQHVEGFAPLGLRVESADQSRVDPEAYRLVLQANSLLDGARSLRMRGGAEQAFDAADKADALARRALDLDPKSTGALMVLALLARNGWTRALASVRLTTEQRANQSLEYVRRALVIAPSDPEALAQLGDYLRRFQWQWTQAENLFRRALAVDPSLIDGHWSYSHQLAVLGDSVAGLDHALTLYSLDPVNTWHTITLPRMLYLVGQRGAATALYESQISAVPDNLFLLYEVYFMHLAEGDAAALLRHSRRIRGLWAGRTMPGDVRSIVSRIDAATQALSGAPERLASLIDADVAAYDGTGAAGVATLHGRARDDLPFVFAMEYGWAGKPSRAVDMLDRALAAKSLYWPACLPYGPTPLPAAVRADPRYDALWVRDSRLAEAVERRRVSVNTGLMAGILPGGRRVTPVLPAVTIERIRRSLPASRPK